MTHAYENITLPQTSFAGGNNPILNQVCSLGIRIAGKLNLGILTGITKRTWLVKSCYKKNNKGHLLLSVHVSNPDYCVTLQAVLFNRNEYQ